MSGVESRRSARISGRFWVAVEGVDAEMLPRHGDISATGIFLEIGEEIGDVGSVQWLHIASLDKLKTCHVMAHVVRHVQLSDLHRHLRGVALEFMPESDEAAARLCEFVRYVLDHPEPAGPTPHIAPRVRAAATRPSHPPEAEASVRELSVNTLLLETDWSVPVGEPLRVEIITKGGRRPIRVEGQAVSILPARGGAPGQKRYRIAVQVKEELKGPLKRFSEQAMPAVHLAPPAEKKTASSQLDQLITALIKPPAEPPERKHLEGLLARIPFTTLCSLIELERLTGVLVVRRPTQLTTLYVRDGRFVDIEPAQGDPRAELMRLFESREGSFELNVAVVDRKDRIDATMTNLLLELARISDEVKSDRDPGR